MKASSCSGSLIVFNHRRGGESKRRHRVLVPYLSSRTDVNTRRESNLKVAKECLELEFREGDPFLGLDDRDSW